MSSTFSRGVGHHAHHHLARALAIPNVKVLSNGVEELVDAPGGGHLVTLEDPEGFPISLVYGQTSAEPRAIPAKIPFNEENDKPRIRAFQRFKPGPAAVYKVSNCNTQIDEVHGN